jgi:hypothetical protein
MPLLEDIFVLSDPGGAVASRNGRGDARSGVAVKY